MKFGVCIGTDREKPAILKELGFDYFETNLGSVSEMSEEDFADYLAFVRACGLPCESSNCFMSSKKPVVCEKPDYEYLREYGKKSMYRAAQLGIKSAVFGSSGARRVPPEIPRNEAFKMIAYFLGEMVAPEAEKNGVRIAIEPLTVGECNIINYVNDGRTVSNMIGKKCIKTLVDLYHFENNYDSLSCISELPGEVIHSHISHTSRFFPAPDDGYDYVPFFAALKAAGCERCSVEGKSGDDFELAARNAIAVMKASWLKV